MISFIRIIRFGIQNFFRNVGLSFMTVLVLVFMLLSINSLFVIQFLATEASEAVKQQIDVSIHFHHAAESDDVEEIRKYVESFQEVTEVTYQSSEEILDEFSKTHKENPDIVASLDEIGENPFGPRLTIKARQPEDYQKVITALSIPEYDHIIEAKTFSDTEKAIEKIDNITTQVEYFSYLLISLFGVIAFVIIFNTIRIAIYTQRTEISIKKLVGASNWFIRGPYVVVSFVYSVISVIVAYGLVIAASKVLDPYIAVVFEHRAFLTEYFLSNILLFAGIQFIIVFLLTIISSSFAMRRHLRV